MLELHDAPVDLGAHAGVADVGVDGVREIDGRRAARQGDHAALGREAVDFLRIQIHFKGGHELAGIAHIALPFDQLAEPGDALIVIGRAAAAFFVLPVRRDALLGDAVHLIGADLDFEMAAFGAHDGRVQGLVQIGPRDGDKILDPAGDGMPLVVNDAQSGVTVLHRIGNDAHSEKIVDLVQDDLLALELLEHGVGPFHASFDARGNPFAGQVDLDDMLDLVEKRFIAGAGRLEFAQQAFGGLGLQIPERQVLQLAADLSHAQAVGDGRVDIHGFLGDAEPFFLRQRTQRAHVMQAVGQLDQDDADIVDHGQQHLADAFGLAFLARGQVELAQLGDPVDAAGHLVAELLADLFDRRGGVFDHIVQESGLEADHVHVHVGELAGDQQGMGHVGFAGDPGLAEVAVGREAIGAFQGRQILFGAGFPQVCFQAAVEGFDRRGEARPARLQATGQAAERYQWIPVASSDTSVSKPLNRAVGTASRVTTAAAALAASYPRGSRSVAWPREQP